MKATRHNGRSGKNGTYNPRHNDRRFDLENSEHIDAGRVRENIYWDCYRGYTTMQNREEDSQDISFEKIECTFYQEHYGKYIEAQNERNARTRHTERNRSVEDLLKNNKTCPEETIFQIGTVEESVSYEILLAVVQDFTKQFTNRFGSHVHILDWALHLDEGTPHIHERHVFDCENKYGEICPQQEKALEELGIALPKPDKPKGRNNNRKQTFDAICRTMLFDITRKYGLHLEEEPSYGGRDYLEKQDYILFKQKKQMKNQTEILDTLTLKIEEVEALIDEVSDIAYDKAVEVVTDEVRVETHKEDIRLVEQSKAWVLSPERKASQKERTYAVSRLDGVITKITKAMQTAVKTIQTTLIKPEVKKVNTEQIKKKARSSILDRLAKAKITAEQENRERWEHEGRTKLGRNDMELCCKEKRKRMNIFEAVKQSVTTRQAAESYGIRVNKNGMAVCPFHRDKNPSMKVDRRFHCFGCQADGDVIDFTAHLYNLKPKEAAEKLARDFSIHYENMGHSPPQRKQIKRQLTQEQRYLQAENRYFRALADYLHLLKQWKEECAPKQVEDVWHPLFMEALEKISETEYLLDTLLSGTLEERVAVVVAHGKEVTAIEQRISDFITTDTTGIVRSNGYNGNGVDSRGNQRTTGNDTEGCCEKQSA